MSMLKKKPWQLYDLLPQSVIRKQLLMKVQLTFHFRYHSNKAFWGVYLSKSYLCSVCQVVIYLIVYEMSVV